MFARALEVSELSAMNLNSMSLIGPSQKFLCTYPRILTAYLEGDKHG